MGNEKRILSNRITADDTARKIVENATGATWRLETEDPSSYQRGIDEAVVAAAGYQRYARMLTPKVATESA